MIELGYLVFDDINTTKSVEKRISELLNEFDFSKELILRLMQTIGQIMVIVERDRVIHGLFIYIDTEHKREKLIFRIDNILQEINVNIVEIHFDSLEEIIDEGNRYVIYLKQTLVKQNIDTEDIMLLRRKIAQKPDWNDNVKFLEKELKEQRKIAEQDTQSKLDFFSNVSHEIRTPMNIIMGMTYVLEKTSLNTLQKEYIEKTKKACEKLFEIINNVLDLSKIRSEKLQFHNIVFPTVFIADAVEKLLIGYSKNPKVTIKKEIEDKIPQYVYGDPYKIISLLTHYADNAVKFTQEGEICVGIQLVSQNEAHCRLVFSIKDTGIGFKEEEKEMLFHSFRQNEDYMTKQHSGIGLGLAIAKELANQMEGRVGASSVEGKGSTFWFAMKFTIPKVKQKEHVSVLLVEDNSLNQIIVQELLKDKHIKVALAKHGQQGVDLAKEKQYDLILMDLQMPVLDGYEATKEIRKMQDYKDIPIIAMTASEKESDAHKCFSAGMNDYIRKPLEVEEFFFMLLRWLPESDEKRNLLMQLQKSNMQKALEEFQKMESVDIKEISTNQKAERSKEKTNMEDNVLDVKNALQRMMGNNHLYDRLINKFYEEQMTFVTEMKKTLEQGNKEESLRLAHTFKGISGTIGAVKLQKQAENLEKELKEAIGEEGIIEGKKEQIHIKLSEMEHSLLELEKEIQDKGFITEKEEKEELTQIKRMDKEKKTRGDFETFLNEIKPNLELQKPKLCKEIMSKYEAYQWEEEQQQVMDKLSNLIRKYKFKEAFDILKTFT